VNSPSDSLARHTLNIASSYAAEKTKTIPENVATTRTEDGHKRNTKTSTTI
jgi:hypothetical protein